MPTIPIPKRQPAKIAQAIKDTKLQLKTPLEIAQQIAQQIETLPAVNFSFFANNLETPFSLPNKVGQILLAEKLLIETGKKNYLKVNKLRNRHYLKILKAKIIFAIVQSWLKIVFKQGLTNFLEIPEFFKDLAEPELNIIIDFFSTRYANQTTTIFLAEAYPHLLSSINSPKTPVKEINDIVQDKIKQTLKKEQSLIKDILVYIKQFKADDLTPQQEDFINKISKKITSTILALARYPKRLEIEIDPRTFPSITFQETVET